MGIEKEGREREDKGRTEREREREREREMGDNKQEREIMSDVHKKRGALSLFPSKLLLHDSWCLSHIAY